MENLYSIVYCSRNRIQGDQRTVKKELAGILASSRTNNARVNVTGALLYSAGSFAQVLEGSLESIQSVFERIQRDDRHSEVIVIQSGGIEERRFPEWSMAFAGDIIREASPAAAAALDGVFAQQAGAREQVLTMMHDLVVDDADWIFMDTAAV